MMHCWQMRYPTMAILSGFLVACDESREPERASSGATSGGENEAVLLEAARRHPIAVPEPRPLYPAKQPPSRPERGLPEQAPPPRDQSAATPASATAPSATQGAPATQGAVRQSAPATQATVRTRVVAPEAPPPPPFEQRPPRPATHYVWAPGYWYWYGGHYGWIDGSWLPPRRGYVYVGAHWAYASDGWVFAPGGWALSGGSVVLYPSYHHHSLHPGFHHHYRGHRHSNRHYEPARARHRVPRYTRPDYARSRSGRARVRIR